MSKTDVPLVATGDWIDAAWLNQYLRDNIAAIWVGTTAGDTDYYLGANTKARLAIGAAGGIYKSDGSVPGWLIPGTEHQLLQMNSGGNGVEWGGVQLCSAYHTA